jgi:hypothetical protein
MYKEGVTFPTYLFFINDEIKISSVNDIQNQINISTESISFTDLVEQINTANGNEIISLLLNYFPNLTFRVRNNSDTFKIKSPFILNDIGFNQCVINNSISLDELEWAINQLEQISEFDKSTLVSEIYLFIYKCYFWKVFEHISFSDNIENKIHFDFQKEIELYFKTKIYIDKFKPYEIKNYDSKKNFHDRFKKSFHVKGEEELLTKIENLFSHSRKEAIKTFGKLVSMNLKFNSNQSANFKNKIFKPLFKIINSFVLEKKYDDSSSSIESLKRENKRFMSSLK